MIRSSFAPLLICAFCWCISKIIKMHGELRLKIEKLKLHSEKFLIEPQHGLHIGRLKTDAVQ
jgi:hypothetical protein